MDSNNHKCVSRLIIGSGVLATAIGLIGGTAYIISYLETICMI